VPNVFDAPDKLLLGLVTGVVFGVLLQKGRVAKFPVIVGQFLLKDWTVAKIMGTAVVVGAVGVYALAGASARHQGAGRLRKGDPPRSDWHLAVAVDRGASGGWTRGRSPAPHSR
jgi:hypothetical protein